MIHVEYSPPGPMIVKDVLQQILDENWVETDKVGINTVYWSFPGQAGVQRKRKIAALAEEKDQISKKLRTALLEVEKECQGKEDSVSASGSCVAAFSPFFQTVYVLSGRTQGYPCEGARAHHRK